MSELKHPDGIKLPKPYTFYRHYKGKYFLVEKLGWRHAGDELVSIVQYHYINDDTIVFIRDLTEWWDLITLSDGTQVSRFTEVSWNDMMEEFVDVQLN